MIACRIRRLTRAGALEPLRSGAQRQDGLRALADLGSLRPVSLPGARAGRPACALTALPKLALRSDVRGVVIVEYVVVLLLVSALACSAIVVLAMAMVKFYASQEAWIGIPLP
jgi:hypothetical protein